VSADDDGPPDLVQHAKRVLRYLDEFLAPPYGDCRGTHRGGCHLELGIGGTDEGFCTFEDGKRLVRYQYPRWAEQRSHDCAGDHSGQVSSVAPVDEDGKSVSALSGRRL